MGIPRYGSRLKAAGTALKDAADAIGVGFRAAKDELRETRAARATRTARAARLFALPAAQKSMVQLRERRENGIEPKLDAPDFLERKKAELEARKHANG